MKKLFAVLVVLVLVVLVWYRLGQIGSTDEGEAASQVARVETTPVKEQSIVRTLSAFGVVGAAPSGERVIAAPYDCVIGKIYVGVGTTVAAGDTLMEIAPSHDSALELQSAQNALALASKSLAAVQQRYDLKLATNQDLLSAQQAEQEAQLRVDSDKARGLGGDGMIVAESAGIVSRLDLDTGSMATVGTPLVSVAGGGQLEARLGVEPSDLAAVRSGQPVVLVSANRSELGPVNSSVRSAGGGLDPSTGAAEVRVSLPAGSPLYLGEHVQASIEVARNDRALVVPRSAVLPEEGKYVLFTVRGGKAERHEVMPGIQSGDLLEVRGGDLQAGDSVVTLGNYELEDGMEVQTGSAASSSAEGGS